MFKTKPHFWYNRRQRNGVLFLVLLIVVLQWGWFFMDWPANDVQVQSDPEIEYFQGQVDSLKAVRLEAKLEKEKIKPFNPSFITDYKGFKLGMSNEEIDRLLVYRKSGNYINSVKQFQEVTKVSDSLLAVISPYFKFPDWVVAKRSSNSKVKHTIVSKSKESIVKLDINKVSEKELMNVNGVGGVLSKRIVKYRDLLNGFVFEDQLEEVYGLDPSVIEKIWMHFSIISRPDIEKVNVNSASFKEVLQLPYIDYELTKKIFQLKDEKAEIQSLEELKNIEDFPLDKFDRIALYLHPK